MTVLFKQLAWASWYESSMLMFNSRFVIVLITISTMSDEWIFSLSTIFLNQAIFNIFKFSWSLALSFISFLMIIFRLLVFSVMCISCVSIAKLQHITCAESAILFTHFWDFFKAAWASELTACNATSSLSSLQINMIRSRYIINMFSIFWKIWSTDFFCISFIFFLFTIFTRTSRLLQSNDKSPLSCCFLIVVSSLATLTYDDVLNVKRVFFYACSCLLRSWMNVFNFCTFFAMNASWFSFFSIFLSEMFWKCWISFKVTFFHEWSLLFSFFNVDVCVSRSMMLIMFILSLRKRLNLASLFLCDESTLLAIVFESALLLFMQFVIIYSSTWFLLSHL